MREVVSKGKKTKIEEGEEREMKRGGESKLIAIRKGFSTKG